MFGGATYAQYSLLGNGDMASTKRQSGSTVRSTITNQISLWFRTEMNSGHGLLFYMGSTENGEELYIQVLFTYRCDSVNGSALALRHNV